MKILIASVSILILIILLLIFRKQEKTHERLYLIQEILLDLTKKLKP